MTHLREIPRTVEVEMLEDTLAIQAELQTALASAKQLKSLLQVAEADPTDGRVRQALLLQVVTLLARAVTRNGEQKDKGRKYPLSTSIYDRFENGAEAWDFFRILRDKILIHDESPAFQVRVGAFRVGGDVAVGHLAMTPAFEHDPECIDMLGQMISQALAVAKSRVEELTNQVRDQLSGWNAATAPTVRVTVPPKEEFKANRRTWKAR